MPRTGENIYKRKDGRWEARKSKIGLKPKDAKVRILHFSHKTGGKFGDMIVSCLKCKSNYFIGTISND